MALENRIFFRTVSSNVGHFHRAMELMPRVEERFPGVLGGIITSRFAADHYEEAFESPIVKNVIRF